LVRQLLDEGVAGRRRIRGRRLTGIGVLVVAIMALAGCDNGDRLTRAADREETGFAARQLDRARHAEIKALLEVMAPELRRDGIEKDLRQIQSLFPRGEPLAVQLVDFRTHSTSRGVRTVVSFQYDFADAWVAAEVVLRTQGDDFVVSGITVNPLDQPLQEIHRFAVRNLSGAHYVVMGLAGLILAAVSTALVRCLRAPLDPPRKWLWALAILCGIGRLTLNWTTGKVSLSLLYIQVFSLGAYSSSPYLPWIVSLSLPVGALMFLVVDRSKGSTPPATSG